MLYDKEGIEMKVNSFANMTAAYQASAPKPSGAGEPTSKGPEDSFKPSGFPDPEPFDFKGRAIGAASEALTGTVVAGALGALTKDPKIALGMAGFGFVAGAIMGFVNE